MTYHPNVRDKVIVAVANAVLHLTTSEYRRLLNDMLAEGVSNALRRDREGKS